MLSHVPASGRGGFSSSLLSSPCLHACPRGGGVAGNRQRFLPPEAVVLKVQGRGTLYLAMSGGVFGCNIGMGCVTYWHREGRGQGCRSTPYNTQDSPRQRIPRPQTSGSHGWKLSPEAANQALWIIRVPKFMQFHMWYLTSFCPLGGMDPHLQSISTKLKCSAWNRMA